MSESMGYMRLNEAFQYVSDELLDIVEQEKGKKKRRSVWGAVGTVAACICLLIVLPVVAMANNWFGLRELFLPKEDKEYSSFTFTQYHASSEVLALREWRQFVAQYDVYGTILSQAIENGFTAEGREDWSLYGVYSYDMGEKLDKIAKKYGLRLHTAMDIVSFEELKSRVGGNFIEDVSIGDCQVYENGSFHFVGEVEPDGCGTVAFQFTCAVKGTLEESIPYMGREGGYDEWQYDAACGESVRLGLGIYDARMLKESDDRYIIVVVSYGRDYGITKENLQEMADKINFGMLMDMHLPEISDNIPTSNETQISLSGYTNSTETQALIEWQDFLANYDTDRKIADEIGNGIFIAEGREEWVQYSVYSYEMGEKLDEIAEKYDLKLHTDIDLIKPEELMYRVGGCFMDTKLLDWAYIYEDGYFHVDGDAELDGCGLTGFQLTRSVKGTFNDVTLNIGQIGEFVDWQYVTACGEPVLLALGPYKALIFADYEECFISVNVLLGSEDGMTQEDLQGLADKIDFRILKDVQVPDMRGDSE